MAIRRKRRKRRVKTRIVVLKKSVSTDRIINSLQSWGFKAKELKAIKTNAPASRIK